MLNLNRLKAAPKNNNPTSAAKLRLQEDLKDFNIKDCSLRFPDPDNLMNFEFTIIPDEGYYKNALIDFSCSVTASYPHEPPKVKCLTHIFHPNIDSDGNICLNILREDWCPVLSINAIVLGLQYLLLEPRPEDALNTSAADMLTMFPSYFGKYVVKLLHQNKAFSRTSRTSRSSGTTQ